MLSLGSCCNISKNRYRTAKISRNVTSTYHGYLSDIQNVFLAKMYDFPILHHSKYNPQQLEYNSANEI